MNSYDQLIQRLEAFIKKYYLSKILQGSLLFVAGIVSLYLLLSIGEFTFYFSSIAKWILISASALLTGFALINWIVLPFSKYLKIGKTLSHEEAARIIGVHFENVQDKLLNILQLKNEIHASGSPELVQASIEQKTKQINWVPFASAIDLRENKRFLKYALPPLLLLTFIWLAAPHILTESNARLSQPSKTFAKPAPFDFIIDTKQLSVKQFDDLEVIIEVKGKSLPSKMEWVQNGRHFPVKKVSANQFIYTVQNVEKDIEFRVVAHGFYSHTHTIQVIKKPAVSSMKISLQYPSYTGRKNETVQHGDLVVPIGTKINWNLRAENTQKVAMSLDGQEPFYLSSENSTYTHTHTVNRSMDYKIYAHSSENSGIDSVLYSIASIEDEYPQIQVQSVTDSSQMNQLFFMGQVSDDYGINKLNFQIVSKNEQGQITQTIHRNVPIPTGKAANFTYHFHLKELNLKAGEKAEYHFTVWDNDAVQGSKSTKSQVFIFSVPKKEVLKEQETAHLESIKSSMQSASHEAQQFSKELQSIKEKLLTKKNLTWEDKKEIQDLIQKHESLKNELQDLKNKFDENLENQDLFKNTDEDVLEKQELLQEAMEELMSDEMQKLMEELQELINKLQKNQAFDKLEDIEMNNQKLHRNLDKMLELFKKLEFEQKASDIANQLDELADKQDELQGESDSEKQDALNQEFEELQKDLEELEKLNEQQKSQMDLDEAKEQSKDIQQNMSDAKDELDNQKQDSAKDKQQKASDGMRQMSENMRAQMQAMQMQQHLEDIHTIRRILSNLLNLSMDQEELMLKVRSTHETDVKYYLLKQEQQKINEKSIIIEDSLVALGKRVFEIKSFITDELYKMKRELKKSSELLDKKNRGPATASQQFAMTSANNLALMLSETMSQMQLQMQSMSMSGDGSCENPDGSSPSLSPGEMQKLQEELGQDMSEMGQKLERGESGKEVSKELAEMAQRQAAIREALKSLKEQMSQKQKSDSNIDQLIDDLDKNERDIVNKKITQETLMRQKNIESRMLDFEDAMRDQDEKEERSSNTAQDMPVRMPDEIEEFLRNKNNQLNTIKYLPPEMKPFYRNLVNKYNSSK